MMWRAIASNALTLFVVVLFAVAGLLAWGQRVYVGPGPMVQAQCFAVDKGANLAAVSRALKDRGVIADDRIFRIGAAYSDRSGQLKFGSYLLPAQVSM